LVFPVMVIFSIRAEVPAQNATAESSGLMSRNQVNWPSLIWRMTAFFTGSPEPSLNFIVLFVLTKSYSSKEYRNKVRGVSWIFPLNKVPFGHPAKQKAC